MALTRERIIRRERLALGHLVFDLTEFESGSREWALRPDFNDHLIVNGFLTDPAALAVQLEGIAAAVRRFSQEESGSCRHSA